MKTQNQSNYLSSRYLLKTNSTLYKTTKTMVFVFACVSLFTVFTTQSYAQSNPTFVRFSFDGTTTCSNEISLADSLASYIVQSPWPQMKREDIECVQTTGTNNRFNSKEWSTEDDYDDYEKDTYAYFSFQLTSPNFFSSLSGIDLMFAHKRSGNGPSKGFIRTQFYKSDGTGSGWIETSVWTISNSTVYDKKYHFTPPDVNYVKMTIQFHGFDQKNSGGNGDAEWFDNVRVVGNPEQFNPVELVSFTASVVSQSVELKWNTATEINNYGFDVQRSTNGTEWVPIAFIAGHGTVNTPQSYSYKDENIGNPGSSIKYRLKQIDRDGRTEFSPIVQANFNAGKKDFGFTSAYPNPFNPSTMLSFYVPNTMPVSLKVYDLRGRVISTILKDEQLQAGMHTYMFEASRFSSGTYYASLTSGGMKSVSKIVLAK